MQLKAAFLVGNKRYKSKKPKKPKEILVHSFKGGNYAYRRAEDPRRIAMVGHL